MRPVSLQTFIDVVYCDDNSRLRWCPIRNRCPDIPGAFRDGRRWRIDLDTYFETMERRLKGLPESNQELGFLQKSRAAAAVTWPKTNGNKVRSGYSATLACT